MVNLTPFDTGDRLSPAAWSTATGNMLASMDPEKRAEAIDRFGKVDFDDEEAATVCTVHVEPNGDGTFTVHVVPLVENDQIIVQVHAE